MEACEELFCIQVLGGLGGVRCEWPPLAEAAAGASWAGKVSAPPLVGRCERQV